MNSVQCAHCHTGFYFLIGHFSLRLSKFVFLTEKPGWSSWLDAGLGSADIQDFRAAPTAEWVQPHTVTNHHSSGEQRLMQGLNYKIYLGCFLPPLTSFPLPSLPLPFCLFPLLKLANQIQLKNLRSIGSHPSGENIFSHRTPGLQMSSYFCYNKSNKKLIRRWDSERELSVRRHRTRTTKYNRLVHSATDWRGGYVWNACLPNWVK